MKIGTNSGFWGPETLIYQKNNILKQVKLKIESYLYEYRFPSYEGTIEVAPDSCNKLYV